MWKFWLFFFTDKKPYGYKPKYEKPKYDDGYGYKPKYDEYKPKYEEYKPDYKPKYDEHKPEHEHEHVSIMVIFLYN